MPGGYKTLEAHFTVVRPYIPAIRDGYEREYAEQAIDRLTRAGLIFRHEASGGAFYTLNPDYK